MSQPSTSQIDATSATPVGGHGASETAAPHGTAAHAAAPTHAAPATHAAAKAASAVPPHERVSLWEKLAIGLGGVAGNVQVRADNFVLTPVFVVTMGVSPALMSTFGLLYRVWDAIGDILTGWLSDSTRSRWGRRKPYILVGSVLMALVMPGIFFFDRNWSLTLIICWMVGWQLALYLFHSIWNIPYQCLLLESTPNSVERTNVAAWRGYVGAVAELGMFWIWWAVQLPIFAGPDGKPDILNGSRWVISGLAAIVLVLGLLPLFVRERVGATPTSTPSPSPSKSSASDSGTAPLSPAAEAGPGKTNASTQASLSFADNLRLTFASHPFRSIVLFTCFMTVSNNLLWSLDFYAKFNYVFRADQQLAATVTGVSGIAQFLLSIAGVRFFQWVAARWGKIAAVKLIMWIGLFAGLSTLVFYTPAHPYLSLIPGLLMTPGNAAIWMLIPSMTGDAVDHDELSTYRRREGSFQSTFSWTFKLSGSLAAAIAGPLIAVAGYNAALKSTIQPDNVVFNLRIMLAVLPAIAMAGAIWALSRYSLGTAAIAEVHRRLAERHQSPQVPPSESAIARHAH